MGSAQSCGFAVRYTEWAAAASACGATGIVADLFSGSFVITPSIFLEPFAPPKRTPNSFTAESLKPGFSPLSPVVHTKATFYRVITSREHSLTVLRNAHSNSTPTTATGKVKCHLLQCCRQLDVWTLPTAHGCRMTAVGVSSSVACGRSGMYGIIPFRSASS